MVVQVKLTKLCPQSGKVKETADFDKILKMLKTTILKGLIHKNLQKVAKGVWRLDHCPLVHRQTDTETESTENITSSAEGGNYQHHAIECYDRT